LENASDHSEIVKSIIILTLGAGCQNIKYSTVRIGQVVNSFQALVVTTFVHNDYGYGRKVGLGQRGIQFLRQTLNIQQHYQAFQFHPQEAV
jgi:hypothetical protein